MSTFTELYLNYCCIITYRIKYRYRIGKKLVFFGALEHLGQLLQPVNYSFTRHQWWAAIMENLSVKAVR